MEVVAEEVGFLPSAVLSFEEPRMLKAESLESEAILIYIDVEVFVGLLNVGRRNDALDMSVFLPRTAPRATLGTAK